MTDTTSAAPSLLPCPFCGGTARRSTGGEGVKAWYGTGCGGSQSCPAYLHGLTHRTQAKADAAWNRRAQATSPAVVEPLTDEQIVGVMHNIPINAAPSYHIAFARAIEQAHGLKGGQHGTNAGIKPRA